VVTHVCSAAGEAAFAVSLAGSIFFSVSADAARPRIVLYLVLTMAPFAVVGPVLGPLVDRVRGGHGLMVVATCLARSAVALALAAQLRTLLFFPLAFGLLVLGKTYSVAKSALVPRLITDPERMVWANARLSLAGTVAGAIGAGVAAGVFALWDASWTVRLAAVAYLAAGLAALRIHPSGSAAPRVDVVPAVIELNRRPVQLAAIAMTLHRAAVGFLVFALAFVLKRGGDPPWMYGLVMAIAGTAGMLGTVIAAPLRERRTERVLVVIALALPGLLALLGAVQWGLLGMLLGTLGVGFGAALGRHAFDSLAQLHAPPDQRARTFARFETQFQVAWVVGALVAVLLQPSGSIGLAVLGAVLTAAALGLGMAEHRATAPVTAVSPPAELLALATSLHAAGSHLAAVVNAVAAIDAAAASGVEVDAADRRRAEAWRSSALVGGVDATTAELVVRAAQRIVQPALD
jgi:MFS family permease